jgi:hypothetical protein
MSLVVPAGQNHTLSNHKVHHVEPHTVYLSTP